MKGRMPLSLPWTMSLAMTRPTRGVPPRGRVGGMNLVEHMSQDTKEAKLEQTWQRPHLGYVIRMCHPREVLL